MVVARFDLRRVEHMPKVLEPGMLYVAEEFEVAGHLCACGCGNKVMTPLGPAEWSFEEVNGQPTLRPSIGSWQLPCRSHYWIIRGVVRWSGQWSPEEIEQGWRADEAKVAAYFEERKAKKPRGLAALWQWVKELAGREFGRR